MSIIKNALYYHAEHHLENKLLQAYRKAYDDIISDFEVREILTPDEIFVTVIQREEICLFFHDTNKKPKPSGSRVRVPGISTGLTSHDSLPLRLPIMVQNDSSSTNEKEVASTSQLPCGETLANSDVNDGDQNNMADANAPSASLLDNAESGSATGETSAQVPILQFQDTLAKINVVRKDQRGSLVKTRRLLNHIIVSTKLTAEMAKQAEKPPSQKLSCYVDDYPVQLRSLKELKLLIKNCFHTLKNLDEIMIEITRCNGGNY